MRQRRRPPAMRAPSRREPGAGWRGESLSDFRPSRQAGARREELSSQRRRSGKRTLKNLQANKKSLRRQKDVAGTQSVEMAGIEPASDDACPSILRVQFAVRCFRPQRSRERVADGPSGVGVPSWPAACQLSSGFRSRRQVLGGKRPQADGFRSSLRRRGRNRCSCSWHLLVRRESLTR